LTERYNEMIGQLELSENAWNKIENHLDSGNCRTSRSNRKTVRILIAAACIFAAMMACTALAREQTVVSTVSILSGQDAASYSVSANLKQYSPDRLGNGLQNDLVAGEINRVFYDRQELEDYLGFQLVSSPELEAAGINEGLATDFEYGFDLYPELTIAPDARYVVTGTMMDGTTAEGTPEVLIITSHRVMRNSDVYITAQIILSEIEKGDTVTLSGESFEPVLLPYHELIINPDNPLDYEVSTTDYVSAEKKFFSYQYTMDCGDVATIMEISDVEMDGLAGFTQYTGYFVRDGILYSIKPYSVYDPNLSFPMNDYDMLTVLKDVLDSFE